GSSFPSAVNRATATWVVGTTPGGDSVAVPATTTRPSGRTATADGRSASVPPPGRPNEKTATPFVPNAGSGRPSASRRTTPKLAGPFGLAGAGPTRTIRPSGANCTSAAVPVSAGDGRDPVGPERGVEDGDGRGVAGFEL